MKELSKEEIKSLINKENPIILDIGCYDGRDSIEFLRLFEKSTVHCFEADPRSFDLFVQIHEDVLNEMDDRIKLHRFAVCNVDGEIEFYQSDSETRRHYDFQTNWSASSSIRKPKHHIDLFPDVSFKEETIRVKATKLDTWYSENLKGSIIDFIWADVNGGEEDLVLGGVETLKNTRYVYIEVSNTELYEGEARIHEFISHLPDFEIVDFYNFGINFGNLLLKNKKL